MSASINLTEFDKAIADYSSASGKDLAYSANRAMRNLAIQSLKIAPRSDASKIDALKRQDYWPKIVAKIIAKRQGKYLAGKAYQSMWARSHKVKVETMGQKLSQREHIKTARAVGQQVIAARKRGISFITAFFWKMQDAYRRYVTAGTPPGGMKPFTGFDISMTPATQGKLSTSVEVRYPYRKRSEKASSGADAILKKTITKAIPITLADMQVYIEKKLAEQAAKINTRAA